jgi:flagellar assembly protein FliH
MSAPHKFLFDRSFDQADAPRGVPRKPPPEAPLSRADVEAARAQGVAEGRKAALAEAARSSEERVATALATLAGGMKELITGRQRDSAELQRRSLEAFRAIMHKAVPALCRKDPLTEIEALVIQCLHEAFEEPRLVLRVADSLFPALRERVETLAASTGFAGKIVLLADETLAPGDARIEWAEGGAERDGARLLTDIDAALARAIEAISDQPAKPLEESKHE